MKYEDFKIGDRYSLGILEVKVISKSDEYKIITTIDNDGNTGTWLNDDLEDFSPIEEELPEEGLLVHKEGAIVYRTGEISGYGFDFNKNYRNCNDYKVGWSFNSTPKDWRKATKQEEEKFIKMLGKECEKHGLHGGTKLERWADGYVPSSNGCHLTFFPAANVKEIWNKKGVIFYKGEFATPLKETTTMPQVGKQYTHKKGNTYTVIGFTNNLGDRENKDFPVTVVYVDQEGRHWSRPLSRWYGSFELKE